MLQLPDIEKSYWRQAYKSTLYPVLRGDVETDVAIIGAGITGLTAAYLLKQAGLKVAVIEKATVGGGTTGRTTGKVTSQHGLIYHDLADRLGRKTAKTYGQANQAAVSQVEQIIKQTNISCDWQSQDNYVYTTDPEQLKTLRREARVAAQLGLPASFTTDAALPFEIVAAVKFSGQATFHPQKYLLGLAAAVAKGGSHVFENSEVTGIRDGSPARLRTAKGSVVARDVIVATNVPTWPLMARGGFCLLEYPTESYIVAGPYEGRLEGMYISPDKGQYSILPVHDGRQKLLFIGGEGHVSGVRLSRDRHYRKLADYAQRHFGLSRITYKWSDRDYMAYDSVPLVGRLYPWSRHIYVASAFRKWGLSGGTAAAMILRDLILDQPNPWAEIFTPQRLRPVLSIPRIAVQHLLGK